MSETKACKIKCPSCGSKNSVVFTLKEKWRDCFSCEACNKHVTILCYKHTLKVNPTGNFTVSLYEISNSLHKSYPWKIIKPTKNFELDIELYDIDPVEATN